MQRIKIAMRSDVIYIPLWFYSNLLIGYRKFLSKKFTFHYGSILMWSDFYQPSPEHDLHSTMVLF